MFIIFIFNATSFFSRQFMVNIAILKLQISLKINKNALYHWNITSNTLTLLFYYLLISLFFNVYL